MKKPIKEWNKEKSSEVMDYMMELVISSTSHLQKQAEAQDRRDEVRNVADTLAARIEACKQQDLINAVNNLATQVQTVKDALIAVAAKLDADTLADSDYEDVVNQEIN